MERQTDRQALVDRESVRRIWILYNYNREADRQTEKVLEGYGYSITITERQTDSQTEKVLEGYGYCITIMERQTDRQALVYRESVRRIWILYNHDRETDRQRQKMRAR